MRYGLAPCVSGFLKWRDGACRALPRPYVLYRKHEKGINHAEIVFLRDTIHTRHREECETHFLTDDEIKEMGSICDQLAEKIREASARILETLRLQRFRPFHRHA